MAEVKATFKADGDFQSVIRGSLEAAAALQVLKKTSNDMSTSMAGDARKGTLANEAWTGSLNDLSRSAQVLEKSQKTLTEAHKQQNLVTGEMLQKDKALRLAYDRRSAAMQREILAREKLNKVLHDETSSQTDLLNATKNLTVAEDNHRKVILETDTAYRKHLGTQREYWDSLRNLNDEHKTFIDRLKLMEARIGGFGKAIKKMLPAMLALIGPVVIQAINALVTAISALGAGIVEILAPLGQLSGVVAGLPQLLFTAAAAFAVVKLGISGMGDALKAVISAQEEQMQNELEQTILARKHTDELSAQAQAHLKVRAAMLELAPEAREFVRIIEDMKPAFDAFKKAIQGALFEGLNRGLNNAKNVLPGLKDGFVGVADSVGDLAARFIRMLSSAEWMRDLNLMLDRSKGLIADFGTVLMNVANIFRDVAVSAEPVVKWIREAAVEWSNLWAKSVEEARKSGDLTSFFKDAIEAAKSFAHVVSGIVEIIFQLGRAADDAGLDMWERLGEGLHDTADGMASVAGQAKIQDWLERMQPVLHELWLMTKALGDAFMEIGDNGADAWIEVSRKLREEFLPVFVDLFKQLNGGFLDSLAELLILFTRMAVAIAGPISGLMVFAKVILAVVQGVTWLLEKVPLLAEAITALMVVQGVIGAFSLLSKVALWATLKLTGLTMALTNLVTGQTLNQVRSGLVGLSEAFAEFATGLKARLAAIAAAVSTFWTGFVAQAKVAWVKFLLIAGAAQANFGNMMKGLGTSILAGMSSMATALKAMFSEGFFAGIVAMFKQMAIGIVAVFKWLGTALTLGTGWIGVLVAAIGIAIVLIIKNWNKFKAFFVALWEELSEFFIGVWNNIKDAVMGAVTAIIGAFKSVWAALQPLFKALLPVLKLVGTIIGGIIVGAIILAAKTLELFANVAAWVVDKLLIGFRMVANGVIDVINAFLWGVNKLREGYNILNNLWGGNDVDPITMLSEVTDAEMDAAAAAVSFGDAQTEAADKTEAAAARMKESYDGISAVVGGVLDYVRDKVEGDLEAVLRGTKKLLKAEQALLQDEGKVIRRIGTENAQEIVDSIESELGDKAPAILDQLSRANDRTFESFMNKWARSHGMLQPFVDETKRATQEAQGLMWDFWAVSNAGGAVGRSGSPGNYTGNAPTGYKIDKKTGNVVVDPKSKVPYNTVDVPGINDQNLVRQNVAPINEQTQAVTEASGKLQTAVAKVQTVSVEAQKVVPASWQVIADGMRTSLDAIKTGLADAATQAQTTVTELNPGAKLAEAFQASSDKIVALWATLNESTKTSWELIYTTINTTLMDLKAAFQRTVDGIAEQWNRLRTIVAQPVSFMVNTVLNTGVVDNFNKILSFLGQKTMPAVSTPFATGGQVPGVGRGDTVPARLTPGEYVVRKDAVSVLGVDFMDRLNKADKRPLHFARGGQVPGLATTPMQQTNAAEARATALAGDIKGAGLWGSALRSGVLNLIKEVAKYVGEKAASNIVGIALSQLGVPYVWGGSNPLGDEGGPGQGFDCSGFTQWVYGEAGMNIPRTAAAQAAAASKLPASNPPPGSLLFYSFGRLGPGGIDHVAIYKGGGMQIDAPHPGATVGIHPVVPDALQFAGTFGKMHSGGLVPGTGDVVQTLKGGEFVFSKKAVDTYGQQALAAANVAALSGGGLARHVVPSVTAPTVEGTEAGGPITLTLVVDGKTLTRTVQLHGKNAELLLGGRD